MNGRFLLILRLHCRYIPQCVGNLNNQGLAVVRAFLVFGCIRISVGVAHLLSAKLCGRWLDRGPTQRVSSGYMGSYPRYRVWLMGDLVAQLQNPSDNIIRQQGCIPASGSPTSTLQNSEFLHISGSPEHDN